MSDREARRRVWVSDWRLLVFAGVFLPLLLGLGLWQLDRAAEKERLLAQWSDPAQALVWGEAVNGGAATAVIGQPVVLTGHYEVATWLLDNRTRDGAPGYEVLTLFRPQAGPPVVINRGWVKAPRLRDELPVLATPQAQVRLAGRLAAYPEPPVLAEQTAANTAPSSWPVRVQALPRQRAAHQEAALASVMVRLQDPSQPGAFRADWEPDMMGPQTHYGYALQWFSLAVALILLTIIASYRKQEF